MSQTFRPSIRFGEGIRPSATIRSNLVGEMPMYIAASSRESPRRGMGRTAERFVERDIDAVTLPSWGARPAPLTSQARHQQAAKDGLPAHDTRTQQNSSRRSNLTPCCKRDWKNRETS